MAGANRKKRPKSKEDVQERFLPEERHQLVEKRAYDLYEKRGYLPGDDLADWFEAERLVQEEIERSREGFYK
jgi:hypothetical protein